MVDYRRDASLITKNLAKIIERHQNSACWSRQNNLGKLNLLKKTLLEILGIMYCDISFGLNGGTIDFDVVPVFQRALNIRRNLFKCVGMKLFRTQVWQNRTNSQRQSVATS